MAAPQVVAGQPEHDEGADDGADQPAPVAEHIARHQDPCDHTARTRAPGLRPRCSSLAGRQGRRPGAVCRPRRTDGPLGGRFLAKSLGQVADLGFGVPGDGRPGSSGLAACLPKPSGTRSWARHGGCRRPRRSGGSWARWLRPCRWVGLPRRIPSCGGLRQQCRGRSGSVVRPTPTVQACRTDGSSVPCLALDGQDDYRHQTKHPTIARLGRFSSKDC